MCKLRRVDLEQSERIFEKITLYVQKVVEELNPQAVILFGSFARGDIHEGSDVDLVVIANFNGPFLDRIKLLLDLNRGIGLPIEPIGYTPEEFQSMYLQGNKFVDEILRDGKVLWGDISQLLPKWPGP